MRKTFLPPLFHFVLAFAGALVFWGTPALRAGTSTYAITLENDIDSSAPNTNYQSQMDLNVNGTNDGSHSNTVSRALIQLPSQATSIPAADIVDATIYLDAKQGTNITNPTSPAEGVTLYPLTQSYDPNTATWTNAVANSSGTTAWNSAGYYEASNGVFWNNPGAGIANASKTNPVICTWDVTNLWGDSNLLNNGALLMFDEPLAQTIVPATSFFNVTFWGGAASGSYPDLQAYIEITTVPEPSTVALLMAGAGLATIEFGRRYRAGRRRLALAGPVE